MNFIRVHTYQSCEKGDPYQYIVTKKVLIPISSIVKIEDGDSFNDFSFPAIQMMELDIDKKGSHILLSQKDDFGNMISVLACESLDTIEDQITKLK